MIYPDKLDFPSIHHEQDPLNKQLAMPLILEVDITKEELIVA